MDLAVEAHRSTRGFPKEELFGLTSQIRRSSGSVPANIAEGWELFTCDLHDAHIELADRTGRMLRALIRSIS